jgi:hypothetical protein
MSTKGLCPTLGSKKVVECSGKGGEKIGDILDPTKIFHKNAYAPNPNPLKNKLNTTQILPYSLTPQMIFKNPSSSRVTWGMSSLGKRRRVRSQLRRNQVSHPIPSLRLSPYAFIVTIVGEMVTRVSFASRGSVWREWQRSGLIRTSTTLQMVYLSLVCCCLGPRRL